MIVLDQWNRRHIPVSSYKEQRDILFRGLIQVA